MENDRKPWKIAALTFPNHIEHFPTLSTNFLSFPGVWKVTEEEEEEITSFQPHQAD